MLCVVFINPTSYHIEGNDVWIDLILLGIVTSVYQFFFTGAYHYVNAIVVSSMRYIQVPLAGFSGYLLFAEIMTADLIRDFGCPYCNLKLLNYRLEGISILRVTENPIILLTFRNG